LDAIDIAWDTDIEMQRESKVKASLVNLNVDNQGLGEQYSFFGHDTVKAMLHWIADYSLKEDFPTKYMQAICTIVSKFNESEESEKEIFEFVEKLKIKYK
jgi:hypothetical protein